MRTTTLDSNARGLSPILCGLVAVAVAAVLALWAETAHAIPKVERYVNVSVTPATLDLGSVPQPGTYDSPSELKAHVTANCTHGGVVASMTALTRAGGGTIGLERIFLKLPATGNYVAMTNPVAVTGPMNPGVFDVVLKFRVETTLEEIPGEYTGTLTITCAGAP
ncbi:MAG: hypothetical protein WBD18_06745 [Phycisphaerae bacterium]